MDLFDREKYSIESIKKLGLEKSDSNLDKLILLFQKQLPVDVKREIVSSIGRQNNNDRIYEFIKQNVFMINYMDVIYQMYRTCLYKKKDEKFKLLGNKILSFYDNEVMYKMKDFFEERQKSHNSRKNCKQIIKPTLLKGDNLLTLNKIQEKQIQLIFTSPPYYNARIYSDYKSYKDYLNKMYDTLVQCNRILEDGRFIIINVSPVITKRPGREFESIRYPIHFDFHNILEHAGFYFIDEIIWIKPEYSVPNRVAGYMQTKMPLSYKPNCITDSILVYRKNSPFLLDKNIKKYDKSLANSNDTSETTNCWYISPKSSKNHPAVFPDELCEKVLKYYSFKNDVVLDPFAGSGTFGYVAQKMGRIPVLCEINPNYLKLLEKYNYDNL